MTTTVQFSAQIQPQQVKDIAKQGFKTLINNRPDGEEANQPLNADIEQAAKEAGLAYKAILFAGGQLTQTQVEEFAKFYNQSDKPVLMFCRTGNRSNMLYQTAEQMDLLDD